MNKTPATSTARLEYSLIDAWLDVVAGSDPLELVAAAAASLVPLGLAKVNVYPSGVDVA